MSTDGRSAPDLSDVPFPALVAEMIRRCGDDPDRDGMARTPERVHKAMTFLTQGYRLTAADAPQHGAGEGHRALLLV
jgi:GTP cyclohydrolase I